MNNKVDKTFILHKNENELDLNCKVSINDSEDLQLKILNISGLNCWLDDDKHLKTSP